MTQMPAVSLAAMPGRRKATIDLAREIEKRRFSGIYCPSFGDGLGLCEAIALATKEIRFGTAITNPLEIWEQEYAGEPFVEVTSTAPSLRDVVRRNVVRVSVTNAAQVRQPTLIVVAAIDNLMKGAAGQEVQNANLMLGIPEPMGLPL